MNYKIIQISIVILTFYCQTHAQIVTDRPDQTESSSTVPKGTLQIESGIQISFAENNEITTRQALLPTNLFRFGLAEWIEIRFLNQLETIKVGNQQNTGISDLEIGTKIQIYKEEDRNTEIAVLSHLIVPTGTNEITGNSYGISNKLSISHELNEMIGVGYNVGYNYFGEGNGDITYSLAFGLGVNNKVGMYVEPFGELFDMSHFVLNFDTGFTYLVTKNLQFDFSFGVGLTQQMNYVSIGCSWALNKD